MIQRTSVDVGDEELNAIRRVFERGQFVKGEEAKKLEEEFASYQNTRYGATVNSGTSALHLSLLALNISQGDEIILPPNTFAATVNAIIIAGAKPIFVDINPETYTIDVEKIEKKISPKTKGIIPVHLYGLMADMYPIIDLAEKHDLFVLEDACQAHGAKYYNKKAGELGDIAAFSFFPTKNTTVAGDGGIVISNNEELITKVKALRDHGRIDGKHVMAGLNNRLSEILAAIGRSHLLKLDSFNSHRRKTARVYNEMLKDVQEIILPKEPKHFKHVFHLFTIRTSNRDELKKYLKEHNIGSKIMYKEKLNTLDYVVKVTGNQPMSVNDKVNKEILSLPISGSLNLNDIKEVCEKIIEFYN
ncbi:MAG: DegT/DnrJ/EryC1/StrS family aminotransferase [Candidatus Heimdallarchaeaceae archaeon]